MAKAKKAARDPKPEDLVGINVRKLPRQAVDHIEKWAKKEDQTKSSAIRIFVRKSEQYLHDFDWKGFKNAKIVAGGEPLPDIPEPDVDD